MSLRGTKNLVEHFGRDYRHSCILKTVQNSTTLFRPAESFKKQILNVKPNTLGTKYEIGRETSG